MPARWPVHYLRTVLQPIRNRPSLYMSIHSQFLFLAASIALLSSSCSSDAEQGTAEEMAPISSPQQVQGAASIDPATGLPAVPSTSTTSSAGLNPPHGEPGHVCEIPVGAPLDGSANPSGSDGGINIAPPTGNATPTFSTMPAGSPVNAAPASGGSGRLNPAHGEPGHVCEIPVGQPLP